MNKATAIAFKIPTNASVAFPVGTVLTVLNYRRRYLHNQRSHLWNYYSPFSAGATAASPTLAQYKSAACIKTVQILGTS